ncbi:MAG: transposase family protein [Chloroflexi bacterium]|nr:transposase family protein [Chloroflexota bacterium]
MLQEALVVAWTAANCICAKRLAPFLPALVESLERHGHLVLSEEVRRQLLTMSAATADRIMSEWRADTRMRGATTTKAGKLLKHQIPIRTFAEWNETQPGFFEADLVAHCGTSVEGMFLWSLVLTDIATGWTECLALRHRSKEAVVAGLDRVRQLLPFTMLGFDTDNGSEFLNATVLAYCEASEITFTRGRAYKKNGQCYIEQKNGSIVRQLIGYDRFEGEFAYRQLSELYRAVRLYVNFFQPFMKLVAKKRQGSQVRRKYDLAQTPVQRLLTYDSLEEEKQHLQQVFHALDPVRLLRQIQTLQDALWRHAIQLPPTNTIETTPVLLSAQVSFDPSACMPSHNANVPDNDVDFPDLSAEERTSGLRKRKYHRKQKLPQPRTYRTRKDPFEEVTDELYQWFLDAPDVTAKALLQKLQTQYPNRYPDNLLRTLQRRVAQWRTQIIITFDDHFMEEDTNLTRIPEPQLRAMPADHQHVSLPLGH